MRTRDQHVPLSKKKPLELPLRTRNDQTFIQIMLIPKIRLESPDYVIWSCSQCATLNFLSLLLPLLISLIDTWGVGDKSLVSWLGYLKPEVPFCPKTQVAISLEIYYTGFKVRVALQAAEDMACHGDQPGIAVALERRQAEHRGDCTVAHLFWLHLPLQPMCENFL